MPFDDASVGYPPSAFGTFRVLHQIGSGVLGPVFRAYDSERDCLVAIKAFKLDSVPEQAEALVEALREIATRPAIHPGVVDVGDAGLEGTIPYLVLEYASGDGLDVAVRATGAFTPVESLGICRSLAEAIDAAWDHGVGHGALHPRDVFVQGEAIAITGFGVAQALEQVGLKAPIRRPYSAPERVNGESWDRRADVFSLAAIAQELLAVPDILNRYPSLSMTLGRGLADQAELRFATAADFVAALSEALRVESDVVVSDPRLEPAPTPSARFDDLDEDPVAGARIHADDPIEIEPASPVLFTPAISAAHHQPFPWAATIAVLFAGLALGAVGGYRLGRAHGEDAAIAQSILGPAHDTRAQAETTPSPPAPTTEPTPVPPVQQVQEPPIVASPAETRTAPTRSAPGSVYVDSRPRGARVTVDGRRVGQTPLLVEGLLPGDHRVLIELAGHRRVSSTVKILAGKQARRAVTLEESPGGRR